MIGEDVARAGYLRLARAQQAILDLLGASFPGCRDIAAHDVGLEDTGERSGFVAAMQDLRDAGLLTYEMFVDHGWSPPCFALVCLTSKGRIGAVEQASLLF